MKQKGTLIFTLMCVCIGVIFIVVGIVVLNQDNKLKKICTEETIGVIVKLIREEDSDGKSTYFPVIEYQAGDRTVLQESRSGQNPPKYKKGEEVEIYYNPNNVKEYIIKGDSTASSLGIFAIVLGAIAVIVEFIVRNSYKEIIK